MAVEKYVLTKVACSACRCVVSTSARPAHEDGELSSGFREA